MLNRLEQEEASSREFL